MHCSKALAATLAGVRPKLPPFCVQTAPLARQNHATSKML